MSGKEADWDAYVVFILCRNLKGVVVQCEVMRMKQEKKKKKRKENR